MSKYIKLEDALKAVRDNTMPLDCWHIDRMRAISSLPTIEVSEDCISKAYLEQEIEREVLSDIEPDIHYGWNWALNKVAEIIRNAPSVVPNRAEGKWIMHVDDLFPCESTQECSVCHSQHLICGNDDNYCPYCGAYMKG